MEMKANFQQAARLYPCLEWEFLTAVMGYEAIRRILHYRALIDECVERSACAIGAAARLAGQVRGTARSGSAPAAPIPVAHLGVDLRLRRTHRADQLPPARRRPAHAAGQPGRGDQRGLLAVPAVAGTLPVHLGLAAAGRRGPPGRHRRLDAGDAPPTRRRWTTRARRRPRPTAELRAVEGSATY
ncbi:hypothetical protein V2I01_30200 [Micromonospora sp. BRA006-A]|nr:hypothetical protein [Micromonospora sp. BRA006-A]